MSESTPTAGEIEAFVALATAVAGAFWWLAQLTFRTNQLWEERDKNSDKLNTIWTFVLRRGQIEGQANELFDMNSPIKLRRKAFELFERANLIPELKTWYGSDGSKCASDTDLTLAIEDKFGHRLMRDICTQIKPPLVLSSCILIAAAIAKGAMPDEEMELAV